MSCYTLLQVVIPIQEVEMKYTKKLRWFERFVPQSRMFHGLGKGLGRGSGPRLADAPAKTRENREREAAFARV